MIRLKPEEARARQMGDELTDCSAASNLPPDLGALSRIIDDQPPEMRELFQFALAMLLVEDHKAMIVHQGVLDACEIIYLWTTGKEVFNVVKPVVGDDVLARLREMARDALRNKANE